MGRQPCCSKSEGLNRGQWSVTEDAFLMNYIQTHGEGSWRSLPKKAGLLRCGKSCRLRWMNYLRPNIKRGNFSNEEDDLIISLHSLLGNKWSIIAKRIPGRTDNEIKNYWNTRLHKRVTTIDSPAESCNDSSKKNSKKKIQNKEKKTKDVSSTTNKNITIDKGTDIDHDTQNYMDISFSYDSSIVSNEYDGDQNGDSGKGDSHEKTDKSNVEFPNSTKQVSENGDSSKGDSHKKTDKSNVEVPNNTKQVSEQSQNYVQVESLGSDEAKGLVLVESFDFDWSDIIDHNEEEFLSSVFNYGGMESSCIDTNDDMLEKMFEEYHQLLQP